MSLCPYVLVSSPLSSVSKHPNSPLSPLILLPLVIIPRVFVLGVSEDQQEHYHQHQQQEQQKPKSVGMLTPMKRMLSSEIDDKTKEENDEMKVMGPNPYLTATFSNISPHAPPTSSPTSSHEELQLKLSLLEQNMVRIQNNKLQNFMVSKVQYMNHHDAQVMN